MKTQADSTRLSPQEFAALMDSAKLRAVALRNEAIDEFWLAAGQRVRAAWQAMVRKPRVRAARRRAAGYRP